jgi:hypothetical protein
MTIVFRHGLQICQVVFWMLLYGLFLSLTLSGTGRGEQYKVVFVAALS